MSEQYQRPSWDQYFLDITEAVAKRGTCDRGRCGSIIVRDKRILTTGYVGSPAGLPHCDEVGHEMHEVIHDTGTHSKHCIRTIHAEQNALIQAARCGIAVEGATIYTKMMPCPICAKLIINAGIVRVVSLKHYHGEKQSIELFKQAGVELEIINPEEENYNNK